MGIYLNRHKLEIQTSLSGYLYRAVKNKCLDYLESQEIHKKHHEIILQSSPDHYRMDDSLNAAELMERFIEIIEHLPHRCQQIIRLSRIRGLTNAEIAETLGISKRTVEAQIGIALKRLRAALFPDLIDSEKS